MANKSEDGYRQLKKDLAGRQFSPIYILHGEERYLLDHYTEEFRKKLVEPGTEGFNLIELEGKAVTLEAMTDALEGLPVFAEHKLVIFRDYDLYRVKEEQKAAVEAALSDIQEGCVVLFIYDVLEYKPDARTRIHKILEKNARVIDFQRQDNQDLVPWIQRQFRAYEKTIDSSVAEYMLFICGRLMHVLKMEAQKVAAYSKRTAISKSDIDEVCIPVLEAAIYELTDAIVEQQYERALKTLGDLLAMKHEPIYILAAIGKQIRLIYQTKLLQSPQALSELLKELGVRSAYAERRIVQSGRRISRFWCEKSLLLCADFDRDMKSTGEDRGDLLDLLLLQLNQISEEERDPH